MKVFYLTTLAALFVQSAWADNESIDQRIQQAMQGDQRSAANSQRDAYRHPAETLKFFGLADGMKVLEISPGGGWYTEILAPVMRDHGEFDVASWDMDIAGQPDYRYNQHKNMLSKFEARPDIYDQVGIVAWSPPETSSLGEAGVYDLILTFRNTHGWVGDGIAEAAFAEFARVLKPGGALGVVQHRAAAGSDAASTAEMGYLPESAVIEMAQAAGLQLEASSEVNANPADTRDYPEGVWSLPPGLDACSSIEDEAARTECEAPYLAIGESDRMTLLFRKP